jgi:site-specific recombinase XerD
VQVKVQAAIQGFLMDWELRQRSPATLRLCRSCLAILARWLEGQSIQEVEDITIAHLREFILHTQQRPADSEHPHKHPAADGQALNGDAPVVRQSDQGLVSLDD